MTVDDDHMNDDPFDLNGSDSTEDNPTKPGDRLRKFLAANSDADDAGLLANSVESDSEQIVLGDTQPIRPVPLVPPNSTQDEAGTIVEAEPYTSPPLVPPASAPFQKRGEELTIPPPPGGTTGTPLPQRVEEVDTSATRVTPAAYQPPVLGQKRKPTQRKHVASTPDRDTYHQAPTPPVTTAVIDVKRVMGCFLRMVVGFLFAGVFIVLAVLSFLVFQYFSIARALPSVDDLRAKASQFETTRILDRNQNVLYEMMDPNAGKRTYVPLQRISPYLIAATIATEDKEFYNNPGYDPIAILRALWQNYTSGEVVSGASTITQQLARTLLLSPEERYRKTVDRKAREIVLAAEITRKYSKEEILELYLNENNYGNLAYGIQAAAETYFATGADKLTLSQAAFLAGIPQAPAVYDVFSNRDVTVARSKQVIILMFQLSQEANCIYVSTQAQKVCLDASGAVQAAQEIDSFVFQPPKFNMRFPHWVNYIRFQLEEQFDPQTIYRSGFTVYTTIDPGLQELAEQAVKKQVDALSDRNVQNGALIAIQPSTGEILAMVGSADFDNEEISGQVNMTLSPRQPGSSIKPLTYLAAFEKGWTPGTLIWDVPSEFPPSGDPNDTRPPYQPANYDERFHGPVTVRSALANSYNIPAVKALDFVKIYDNPDTELEDGLINVARRMGITTLTRPDYGLSLTLGGGEVTLLELTNVYATFGNGGRKMPAIGITRIVDSDGNLVYEYKPPSGVQVIRAEHAYLINSILSDKEARTPMFGANSVLNLPFQAGVKTGTTNDFRDNWTIGYTPDLAVGVWVGNADYTPMENTTGLSGAAPIWSEFMTQAVQNISKGNPTPFQRPAGIVDRVICSLSGSEPSDWCTSQRSEVFAYDQLPLTKEMDLLAKVEVDTWTGLKASSFCPDFTEEKLVVNVTDSWAIKWIKENPAGREWAESVGLPDPVLFAPERECKKGDPQVTIKFAGLDDYQNVKSSPLDIYAIVDTTNGFKEFSLEYGKGDDPDSWKVLKDGFLDPIRQPEQIYSWDLEDLKPGGYTLRIYLTSDRRTFAEKRLHFNLILPTATPTSTRTPTNTFTPSLTPTETPTPTEILPSSTATETLTPTPSETTAP